MRPYRDISCRAFTLLIVVAWVRLAIAADPSNARPPRDDAELRYWLENMVCYHHFADEEVTAATGLTPQAVRAALKRLEISPEKTPPRKATDPLRVLPYPGGRHPRIGFLDGAVNPQRETKISVFAPWDDASYVVVDVPEAIWWEKELLYLAHTHIPTLWDKKHVELEKLEWSRRLDGGLDAERRLPNGIVFGARIRPAADAVRMELCLSNHTDQALPRMPTQVCVMTKAARGFEQQTADNKVLSRPFAACRSADGKRWIITAWEECEKVWNNPKCPCFHSDPAYPACAAGQTQRIRGWISFYEGTDVKAEFKRIANAGWLRVKPAVASRHAGTSASAPAQ